MKRWRRIADWTKCSVTLVELREISSLGLVTPEAQLRERFPRLASWVAATKVARLEGSMKRRLRDAGVVIYEVEYRSKSEELTFVRNERGRRQVKSVDINALDLGDIDDGSEDVVFDCVDGLLRVFSDGLVTERAVILALAAPPLADRPRRLRDAKYERLEALDPALLPDVEESFVQRVREALTIALMPSYTTEQLRAYIRNALVVGALASAVALGGWLWVHPVIAALAAPVILVCSIVASMYALELRQD